MATSKLQRKTKTRLRLLLDGHDFTENYRPNWLKNPETGRNLELDFWVPNLKLGIEVQGKQHKEFVPHFHGTEQEFHKQRERDRLKHKMCEAHGVCLYEVFCIADIDRMLESIGAHCVEAAYELHAKNTAIKSLSYYAAKLATESQLKHPNQVAMAGFTAKMIHIAEKYNIPLLSVEPDFTLSKIQMAFIGKSVVRVKKYANDELLSKTELAVIMSVNGSVVNCRWFGHCAEEQLIDMDFDLETGKAIDTVEDGQWWLQLETLPDWVITDYAPGTN